MTQRGSLARLLRSLPDRERRRAEISQHFEWLRIYLDDMSTDNWRDMKLRCKIQLDQLEIVINGELGNKNENG